MVFNKRMERNRIADLFQTDQPTFPLRQRNHLYLCRVISGNGDIVLFEQFIDIRRTRQCADIRIARISVLLPVTRFHTVFSLQIHAVIQVFSDGRFHIIKTHVLNKSHDFSFLSTF